MASGKIVAELTGDKNSRSTVTLDPSEPVGRIRLRALGINTVALPAF
jgi:hypothetical protein